MIRVILDDTIPPESLFPFTCIRAACDIRTGILTIREKWELLTGQPVSLLSEGGDTAGAMVVPAHLVPDAGTEQAFKEADLPLKKILDEARYLQTAGDIFAGNNQALRDDFAWLTRERVSQPVPETVQVINPQDVFIEEGAVLQYCILNASAGPIYIGRHTEIMEGSCIRGPFALCEGSVVKMGSHIYGATTIGPYSVAGGEIKNSVLLGYSNKAHDGYLGDSVIGEWCNLGAGTTNSNLKNTVSPVRVWDQSSGGFKARGLKCGLLMGDYSRSAINTSFNTGTTVGICANVVEKGLTPKFIPSFSWAGGPAGSYRWEKALQDIAAWKQLKQHTLSNKETALLKTIFERL